MTEDEWADLANELVRAVQGNGPAITDWITALASVLTLGIAVVAAFVARGQLREASKAREQAKQLDLAKSQPYVVLMMEESIEPDQFDLVIRNYGLTGARDVRIEMDPWPTSPYDDADVPLPEVIPFLAPGQEWRTYWANKRARAEWQSPSRHVGQVSYRGINDEALSTGAILDWDVYESKYETTKHGVHEIAQSLNKIAETLERVRDLRQGGWKVIVRDGDKYDEAAKQKAELIKQRYAEKIARESAERATDHPSSGDLSSS